MVSRRRMKIDVIGQVILLVGIILLACFASGVKWTNATLIILGIWQLASAMHLFYVYKHITRVHYLRTALIIGVSLPVWIYLIGNFAYLPVAGLFIWYFFQTVRDTIIVYNRPKSFWDLH